MRSVARPRDQIIFKSSDPRDYSGGGGRGPRTERRTRAGQQTTHGRDNKLHTRARVTSVARATRILIAHPRERGLIPPPRPTYETHTGAGVVVVVVVVARPRARSRFRLICARARKLCGVRSRVGEHALARGRRRDSVYDKTACPVPYTTRGR